jgi:hypothetical protein
VRWVAFVPRTGFQSRLTHVPPGSKIRRARTCQGGTGHDHGSRLSRDTVNLISRSDVGSQPYAGVIKGTWKISSLGLTPPSSSAQSQDIMTKCVRCFQCVGER